MIFKKNNRVKMAQKDCKTSLISTVSMSRQESETLDHQEMKCNFFFNVALDSPTDDPCEHSWITKLCEGQVALSFGSETKIDIHKK